MYHYLERGYNIHIKYDSRLVSDKTKRAGNNNLQSLTPRSVNIQTVFAMNHVLELSPVD